MGMDSSTTTDPGSVSRSNVDNELTTRVYRELQDAYDYFNRVLFEGRLPPVLLVLSYHRGAAGYFRSKPFLRRDELDDWDEPDPDAEDAEASRLRPGVDEVSLNIFTFREKTRDEILSVLVHEMVHVEQHHYGTPPKRPSHNKEWGEMMERVGLTPSRTGAPGGKRTGRRMIHFVTPEGPFERVVADCPATLDWVGILPTRKKKARAPKSTYECAGCEVKVKGKAELHIVCGECGERMDEG